MNSDPPSLDFSRKTKGREPNFKSLSAALLLLCLAAFGLLLPSLGFYWDDWPWAWLRHLYGPTGMLSIDRAHRPLAGPFLFGAAVLSEDSPLRWQSINLALRWLGGLSLAWALVRVWPGKMQTAAWAAFLFVVYPAFNQQFISINTSRHLFPLIGYCLSVGLMISALRRRMEGAGQGQYWSGLGASLILALASMLSSEYVYGLELLRPIFLWFAVSEEAEKDQPGGGRKTAASVSRTWLPFAGLLLLVFLWRYRVSQSVNYAVVFPTELSGDPAGGITALLGEALTGAVKGALLAWGRVLDFPTRAEVGLRGLGIFWGLSAATAVAAYLYLRGFRKREMEQRVGRQHLVLGAAGLLVGGLPFLAAGLPIDLNFPSDRAMLPLLLGACLFWAGLLELLPIPLQAKLAALALTVGLATGAQHRSGLAYAREWQEQQDFFQQLSWRIPALEPGTALVTQQFKFDYSTDNSLTAPLNWMYFPQAPEGQLPLMLFYLNLRLGSAIPDLENGLPVQQNYGQYTFSGSTDDLLLLYHNPPDCLRILDPQIDAHYTPLPGLLRQGLKLSNLKRIQTEVEKTAVLPEPFKIPSYENEHPEREWCYYYERADLYRQIESWAEAAALGLEAEQRGLEPQNDAERAPFILAFAHTDHWERAVSWSRIARENSPWIEPLLCSIWGSIETETVDSTRKELAITEIRSYLNCT